MIVEKYSINLNICILPQCLLFSPVVSPLNCAASVIVQYYSLTTSWRLHETPWPCEIPLESCVEGIQVSPESYHYQPLTRLPHGSRGYEQETLGTMHNSVDVFNVPSKRRLMQTKEVKKVPPIKLSVVATKTRQETCRDPRMLKSKGQVQIQDLQQGY